MNLTCPVCLSDDTRHFINVDNKDYFRCEHCYATFLDSKFHLPFEQQKHTYDLHNNSPTDAGYRKFLAQLSQPMIERLLDSAQGLDFGCGPGPVLSLLMQEAGFPTKLYDPIYHQDDDALNQQYDFISCTEVAEHLINPHAVFQQLHNMLKPKGWLGIMTCFQTEDARFAQWLYRQDPTHIVFYRAETFDIIAKQHGFTLEIPQKNIALLQKL